MAARWRVEADQPVDEGGRRLAVGDLGLFRAALGGQGLLPAGDEQLPQGSASPMIFAVTGKTTTTRNVELGLSCRATTVQCRSVVLCAPGRDRTCDPVLRRHSLYPLSYGRSCSIVRPGVGRVVGRTARVADGTPRLAVGARPRRLLGRRGTPGGGSDLPRTSHADDARVGGLLPQAKGPDVDRREDRHCHCARNVMVCGRVRRPGTAVGAYYLLPQEASPVRDH